VTSSDARFARLTVIGLGLLGGSVGLAARARGVARRVVGSGRSHESLAAALRRGAVDEIQSGEAAVRDADLVVLATPVSAMPAALSAVAGGLSRGALVTDVGSVKAPLADMLPGLLPPGVHFIGAHPMAGSHRRGIEHARADLFEGAACAVTPSHDAEPDAVERVVGFWRALGARVVLRDPAEHDTQVAWTSHLPHALAFAFSRALEGAPADARELSGPGFRDFTRIARSDAELWSEILAANRKAIAGPLQETARRLGELARGLDANDVDALERFLGMAHDALARIAPEDLRSRPSGGENPEIAAAKSTASEGERKITHD
jgi:prephenate dehydrogenase